MAVNKVKRSIHLAQPQPQRPRPNEQATEQMPVRAHVYRTIAEMNGGFEHVLEAVQTMQKIKHLPADGLNEIENEISRIRAEANRDLMAVLSERELANAAYFQRLCVKPPRTGHSV
jgi:hypothetical protein